ncbi:MAG: CPBP family intramembrane glutamic endopeptidase [Bacteroidales bacterium]
MDRKNIKQSRHFFLILILALILFVPLFTLQGIGNFDFWWWMSVNLLILVTLGILTDKSLQAEIRKDVQSKVIQKILLGLLSAAILYGIFYAGNFIVRWMFDFAGENISNVYGFKGDAGTLKIGLLMLFIIGPGEELLWRGYFQGVLSSATGKYTGFIMAVLLYTLIHVATGNLILILAALAGGIFWGWMYLKYNSLLMNIVSHVAWDILIFLLLPLNG